MSEFKTYWKSIDPSTTAYPSAIYLLLDLIKGRDPKTSGFTPITNKNKLNNGMGAWDGLDLAKKHLRYILVNLDRLAESKTNYAVVAKRMLELSQTSAEELIEKTQR